MEKISKEMSPIAQDSSPTFREMAKKHLEEIEVSAKTHERYGELLARILPQIGEIPVRHIDAECLERLYKQLQKSNKKAQGKAVALPVMHEIKAEKGMSGYSIAKASGVPETTVRAILAGKAVLSGSAAKVAKVFEKSLPDLFSVSYERKRLSRKTILEHHRLVYAILSRAEAEKVIAKNPAKCVHLRQETLKDVEVLSEDAVTAICRALEKVELKWRVAVTLILETGCTRGELMALTWKKFQDKKLRIDSSLNRNESSEFEASYIQAEKVREVDLSDETVLLLKVYKDEQRGKGYQCMDEDWIFTQKDGRRMDSDSLTKWLRILAEEQGVSFGAEILRNTAIARHFMEASSDEERKTIAEELGFKDVEYAVRRYASVKYVGVDEGANKTETSGYGEGSESDANS